MCIRPIVFILLILLLPFHSTAQLSPETLDTLDQLFKEKNYVAFLTKIRKTEEKNTKSDDIRCDLEDMTHFVERQIITNDPNIIFEKRKTNMRHAFIYKKLGDYQTALKYYLIAHSLVEDKDCLDTFAWFIENEICNIYTRLGNFEAGKYFSLLTENSLIYYQSWENLSRFYSNEGSRLYWSNNLSESKRIYLEGLNIASLYESNRGILSNSQGLVQIYLTLNQKDSAKFYLDLGEKKLPSLEDDKYYLGYRSDFEDKKSKYYKLLKDYSQFGIWSRKSIATLLEQYNGNSKSREIAKSCFVQGMNYFEQNKLDSAEIYYQNGMQFLIPNKINILLPENRNQLYPENTFIELFDLKSKILHQQYNQSQLKDAKKGINYLLEAIQYNELILWMLNNTMQDLLSDETKLSSISQSKLYVGQGLEFIFKLLFNLAINNNDSLIRTYFNYSKSQLVNTKIQNKHDVDKQDFKTKEKIRALHDSIITIESLEEKTDDQNLRLIQFKFEIENILKHLEQTILNKIYPKNYIEYSVQQDYIYRLAQLNNKIYFDRIGETAKFDSLFKIFIDTLVNKDPNQDAPIYKQISDFLLQGIDSILPYEFTVIPDANISFIPFDCLKDPFNKNLIEYNLISYSHTYGNSISKDHSNSKEIFTLAPQYPPCLNLPSIERGSFYELKHSLEECQSIQNYYPDAKSLSRHITKNNLLDTLTNASIFHFAGHGKVSNDSSYLLLANNQEHLRYEDISNYYNNLDLVVLSACETGLGAWNPGDGSKSLAKAFIESGTGAVVYSLWNMNDISTQKIMGYFYQYLSKGQAKDEALRNAKLSYLNEFSGDKKQNFYWAGFVATGDMAPILHTNPILHFFQNYWVNGVMFCTILIITIIYLTTKRKN